MKKYFAVIPAAGTGVRFGSDVPKQFLHIDGVSVLERSVAPFLACELVEKIVVVLNKKDSDYFSFLPHEQIIVTQGGSERMISVLNGLNALADFASNDDWVLVHDGVRPFLNINDINKLIKVVSEHSIGGILGVPVKDTIKKINESGEILSTVDREVLWHASTPQLFRYGLLKEALSKAVTENVIVTDESHALERLGKKPIIVQGCSKNTKITFIEDLTQHEEA